MVSLVRTLRSKSRRPLIAEWLRIGSEGGYTPEQMQLASRRYKSRCIFSSAEMGEHQLTIRDYLRHSNLHVTNKYLQATSNSKRQAQEKLVDAILPGGRLTGNKSNMIQ